MSESNDSIEGLEYRYKQLDGCCGAGLVFSFAFDEYFSGNYKEVHDEIMEWAREHKFSTVVLSTVDPSALVSDAYDARSAGDETAPRKDYNAFAMVEECGWKIVHTFTNRYNTGNEVFMAVCDVPEE